MFGGQGDLALPRFREGRLKDVTNSIFRPVPQNRLDFTAEARIGARDGGHR
jgi:hypothetical protein